MGLVVRSAAGYHTPMLTSISHGTATNLPPVIIAHGLYGSARNWGVIAKRLSDTRQIIAVDMRNHGNSPWTAVHDYPSMADDLAEVIGENGGLADIIGHSMGGKASMVLALQHPQLVRKLTVADIAPVPYSHSQIQFIKAMQSVDLSQIERRSDVETLLAEQGVEKALQSFFTQSLDIPGKKWRLNLELLGAEMPKIMSFPDLSSQWDGPTLFLSGSASDYVLPEYREAIRGYFPKAKFAKIPGAGHWLHAEKPREFEAATRAFLDA